MDDAIDTGNDRLPLNYLTGFPLKRMDFRRTKQNRSRLQNAFLEPPYLEGYQPSLVLWRFPHLESLQQSWSFLVSPLSGGILRRADWDQFTDCRPTEAAIPERHAAIEAPLKITDVTLNPEEIAEALAIFSNIVVQGDQRSGIYDGPVFGRSLYDEVSGALQETLEWIREDTFEALRQRLSQPLRQKMQW